jgi:hypothetical protein
MGVGVPLNHRRPTVPDTLSDTLLTDLVAGVCAGDVVPYLGPGVLADVRDPATGQAIPADSDSLILAMNGGRPMAPRLMYEFPRAAMHVELSRGRCTVTRFLDTTYGDRQWSRATVHDWIARVRPPYVVDINRDRQLQESYGDVRHTLIRGVARMGGSDYRFRIHYYDGTAYHPIEHETVDPTLPILFKPMGSPLPEGCYIASDADYVDYITELMGGFAIPPFLKEYRQDKRYLLLGLRLTRDTERMVLADVVYAAGDPAGWALIPEATDKEHRFCERLGIQIIPATIDDLLAAADVTG